MAHTCHFLLIRAPFFLPLLSQNASRLPNLSRLVKPQHASESQVFRDLVTLLAQVLLHIVRSSHTNGIFPSRCLTPVMSSAPLPPRQTFSFKLFSTLQSRLEQLRICSPVMDF